MPELPEVETIARGLRGPLSDRKFTYVKIGWENAIRTPIPELMQDLPGRTILQVARRAKYLHFLLSNQRHLLLHLKMSGSLSVVPMDDPAGPHVRTTFGLDNNHELRFKDPRKFGRVYFVRDLNEVIGLLGPEPLADTFTKDDFNALFIGKRSRLKPLLLDQTFIAGIGNIYADESCFRAGLNPSRTVDTLTAVELGRLYAAIRESLNFGIMHKGASFDAVYRGGEYQNHFLVYSRTGEPCVNCSRPIQRTVLGGRSTHWCNYCQK